MANTPLHPDADPAWDELLRQLHSRPVAQPQPFFYTRVQARLAASTPVEQPGLPVWLRRPAYAVLLGALVFGLSGDGPGLRTGSPGPDSPGYAVPRSFTR